MVRSGPRSGPVPCGPCRGLGQKPGVKW
ncbi:hypothetical protein PENANT_c368G05997, partial [Penicillium antarcticum]